MLKFAAILGKMENGCDLAAKYLQFYSFQKGKALGEEAAAQDVNIVLGPGLNMKRSPLCGRNFEYFL